MNKDIVVLIPCYDPNEKIMRVFLNDLSKEFKNIVLVDDGCNKKYNKFLNELAKDYPIIKHNVNLGKGRGLKNGINYILNNYPKAKVLVTADCDGQHSVKDIKRCAQVNLNNMDSIVLGCRDFDSKNVPFKSRYGNKLTRNILYHFVGEKISDTQTGLRSMSLEVARSIIAVSGERYEYETNVLIEAKKRNIPIKEVLIETIYINDNETSHFNPIKDSIKIYKLFAPFILVTLFAYILETVFFLETYDFFDSFLSIVLFLSLCKLLSALIISLFNKNINLIYTIILYILTIGFIWLLPINPVITKIIVDIIFFVGSLFLTNFKTKKEIA